MATATKFCVDCVHFRPADDQRSGDDQIRYGKCAHPQATNALAGEQFLSPRFAMPSPFASALRLGRCGAEGEWWKAK